MSRHTAGRAATRARPQTLVVRAANHIRRDYAQLQRSLSALAALPHALDDSYVLVEQLVRCGTSNAACITVAEAANRGGQSHAQLKQLETQLAELDFSDQALLAFTRGWRHELGSTMDASTMLITGNEDYITSTIGRAGPVDRAFFYNATHTVTSGCPH